MPSRTWIVTRCSKCGRRVPTGVSMPSRAWIVTSVSLWLLWSWCCFNALTGLNCYFPAFFGPANKPLFQCPHGLELLLSMSRCRHSWRRFQCPHGLELLHSTMRHLFPYSTVSMPSRAWIVTRHSIRDARRGIVSMPSRAWIVTARMSNILNFSWYFLCIPAIYRCILAHLPFFSTNYLSFWGANPLVLFWELAFRTTLL